MHYENRASSCVHTDTIAHSMLSHLGVWDSRCIAALAGVVGSMQKSNTHMYAERQ